MHILLLLIIAIYSTGQVDTSDLNLEQCERNLCVFQNEMSAMKTWIATQNALNAKHNAILARQNVRLADQNIRILEEVRRSDLMLSQTADIEEKIKQQEREIEFLKEKIMGNIDHKTKDCPHGWSGHNDCPHGWSGHNDTCFLVVDNVTATWDAALKTCEQLYGGELAIITDENTNDFLKNISRRSNGNYFWLGASDLQSEGNWMWQKPQSQLDFTNWYKGQPNNGGAGRDEDCLATYRGYDFFWVDADCDMPQNFICQE